MATIDIVDRLRDGPTAEDLRDAVTIIEELRRTIVAMASRLIPAAPSPGDRVPGGIRHPVGCPVCMASGVSGYACPRNDCPTKPMCGGFGQ